MRRSLVLLWVGCVLAACVQGRDLADGERDDARDDRDSSGGRDDGDGDGAPDDGDPDEAEPDLGRPLTYYRDAKPIFDEKCTACHVDGGIGPFPLTSYGEVAPNVALIEIDVEAGIMPPWRAIGPFDVYEGDRRLTETQKDTLLRWIAQGAPEGDPEDEPQAPEPAPRELERVDQSLVIPEYTPQMDPDDYRCFPLEWPYQETKYVTGLSVEPDQTENVHHAIVYHVQPENAAATRQRDADEAGPGYTCFGGSGSLATWLTSYEPGGFGQAVPGDLGFEIRPGSLMLLQVHYNTLNGGRRPDRSRVDFTVSDSVDRVGRVVLLMQALWPAGGMSIPANVKDTMHAYRGRPSQMQPQTTYDIYWVDLHMHALGSYGGIGIIRANGMLEPLLQIADWSYQWQETYLLREPVKLHPGDQLTVECHFDNTAEHQPVFNGQRLQPRNVNWGDGTTDEMCLGNVLIAPVQ
jgi:hypothetical protein